MDADDILFLMSCGESVEHALARVGWTAGAAESWARRHDHQDLFDAVTHAVRAQRRKSLTS